MWLNWGSSNITENGFIFELLIILSEHSLASDWVEHEVESALEEERIRGRPILFPIRVDDAVMESRKAVCVAGIASDYYPDQVHPLFPSGIIFLKLAKSPFKWRHARANHHPFVREMVKGLITSDKFCMSRRG